MTDEGYAAVYEATSDIDAALVHDLLTGAGISVVEREGALGSLLVGRPIVEPYSILWVPEEDVETAQALIDDYRARAAATGEAAQ